MAFFLILSSPFLYAEEIALTIDDLPFLGRINRDAGKYRREHTRFMKILHILQEYHVPAAGFAIAGSIEPGQWEWLVTFKEAGNMIGNHSYLHENLNRMPVNFYIEDVEKADKILASLLSSPKHYRFPYLIEGAGTPKYEEFRNYLFSYHYVIAPVTVDSKDFELNFRFLEITRQKRKLYLNTFGQRYLNFIWAQTVRAQKKGGEKTGRPIKLIFFNTYEYLKCLFFGRSN